MQRHSLEGSPLVGFGSYPSLCQRRSRGREGGSSPWGDRGAFNVTLTEQHNGRALYWMPHLSQFQGWALRALVGTRPKLSIKEQSFNWYPASGISAWTESRAIFLRDCWYVFWEFLREVTLLQPGAVAELVILTTPTK